MKASRKATIYDIARLSGASPSTVSAALGEDWKARRISKAKVDSIRKIALEQGYSTNMQARGLRKASSGLVGLIIPLHDNRYFASISQNFEAMARERGLVPVIASSMRDPSEEQRLVETFVAYAIDFLIVAGAADPDAISRACAGANLRHVFVDLPGRSAPSVVSDNVLGASDLTREMIADAAARGQETSFYFIGGDGDDDATTHRIEGFRNALAQDGIGIGDDQILTCGYPPARAHTAIAALCDRIGGLPPCLFVNSLTVFEGVLRYFATVPAEQVQQTVIGCFDYDPLAAHLQFPVHMMRQDSRAMVEQAYALIEAGALGTQTHLIAPQLIPPRTIYTATDAGNAWG